MSYNVKLEKKLSYVLRHKPEAFDLVLDEEGYADADQVCRALDIDRAVLEAIVGQSDKKRFELTGNKIRALYGHSLAQKIQKEEITPPEFLYHGTGRKAAESIIREGLKPMNRQYVHLSYDTDIAYEVGKRKDSQPVLLRVDAKKAHEDGIRFYDGNERNVLADAIPATYIKPFVKVRDMTGEQELYKGIFWIVDRKDLENNDPYLFRILSNRNGEVLSYDTEPNSKKGDNYNHEKTWNSLPKELTHNWLYNHFPRGRVEIKNNEARIFLNPLLNEERIIAYIKNRFHLNENTIGSVKILIDNSEHYKAA